MEEKIRLAVFGQKRLSREGGIEIVVKELCTRMAQNGCDITCYNRAGHHVSGAEYDKTIEYDGIRQKVVPTIEKKGLAAVSSSFFAALCSAFGRYDVVHIHAEGPAFFCWIPKLFGKRVISTIHGLDWDREKWRGSVASKFIRGGEKNAVKYADEIIVLSKDVQKYFLETYGRETHFIPNGVNRPEVREAKLITDHFGLEKDSYILFLGRLVPEKGIRYLVEAFKNVKTDKKLVIAGGSSDTDESSKYWLSVLNELKNRGVKDILIICADGLSGIKEAIAAAFPKTEYQRCIVHQVRNTLKYVPDKDRKAFASDLKTIYHASDEEKARLALDRVTEKWTAKYPNSMKRWYDNWDAITPIFKFSPDVRKVIYTTNAIESLNSTYRKLNRQRSVFPSDTALLKALYLATFEATKKWTMSIRNWGQVYGELSIMYEGRLPE